MAIAISAWFDAGTEAIVRGIWKSLAEQGLSRAMHGGPYRPHVTLAVYESLAAHAASAALQRGLATMHEFRVTFAALGIFLNDAPTVHLTVTTSDSLLRLHATCHDLLAGIGSESLAHHRANRWNPHCTLAGNLRRDALARTIEFLGRLDLPFDGTVQSVGIIDTPAESELDRIPLRSS